MTNEGRADGLRRVYVRFAATNVDLHTPDARRERAMTNDLEPRGLRAGWRRALAVLAMLLVWGGTSRAAAPEPGTMIGADTAEQAEGLMPPEFVDRYKKGEWRHAVGTPKPGTQLMDPEWIAAGKANEGKFTISDEGSIREVATGKQP